MEMGLIWRKIGFVSFLFDGGSDGRRIRLSVRFGLVLLLFVCVRWVSFGRRYSSSRK